MTDQQRQRVAKIYALVDRGSTPGEKQAARHALDRMMKKYNITDEMLRDIEKRQYQFKYSSDLDHWLLIRLVRFYFDADEILKDAYINTWGKREIVMKLKYVDWVTLECSYEYFRRHMKAQWKMTCAPIVARCRKAKTRNNKRKKLQGTFFDQYIFKSKLYLDDENIRKVSLMSMTNEEAARYEAVDGLEGGQYNRQVTSGYLLEN